MGQHNLRMDQEVLSRILIKELIGVTVNWVKELGHGTRGLVRIFIWVVKIVRLGVGFNNYRRDGSTPSFRDALIKYSTLLSLCVTV